ncbi:hypothetical protein HA402_004444 [Bradysia odoriphaga]|nr:hypothetical protein HA402_004444 [Bradysia odoriphaga]
MLSRNLSVIPTITSRCLQSISQPCNFTPPALCMKSLAARTLTTKSLNKSLDLFTNSDKPITLTGKGPLQVSLNEERPLTIILAWLMSQQKHIQKYAKYYLDNGFDVLTVKTTPWQLLWPVGGSQVVANDLLTFLHQNPNYYKMVVHGFSVGAYLWGETMVKMNEDMEKYGKTVRRVCGQIWDSPVDYSEIPIGVPKSVFPTNTFLRNALERYIVFHMKNMKTSTKCHLKATDQFYDTIIPAPAMFLFSLNDPMVSLRSVETCTESWQKKGLTVNLRAWDEPPHVGIFQRHPEEYQDEVKKFMERHVFKNNRGGKEFKEAMAV